MSRIAVIAPGLSGGGSERVAAILANYFASRGHEVLFIAALSKKREYHLDARIQYKAIETEYVFMPFRLLSRSMNIQKEVSCFRAEVVYSFIIRELVLLMLGKIPVIPSLRNDPKVMDDDFLRRHIRRSVFRRAKAVVFQTFEARDYFEKSIRDRGLVIGNPLSADLPDWDCDHHRKVFMTACRIVPQKNLPLMIDAFAKFHGAFPEHKLEIYGEGTSPEYQNWLEQRIAERDAQDYISFKGFTDRIHGVMRSCEAFVLSSDFEGLSNSMLEALAIGVPTICTDCPPGGARAYIENGENGLLVPVGGMEELYQGMCRIADSPELRRKLSEKAKAVRTKLNADAICSQWESLI